jgi:uncharacterized protein (DUF427 family)
MTEATWRGATLARSDATIALEGNAYFPPDAVDRAHLRASSHTSRCPWKGVAHYFDVVVDGEVNENAAWVYPEPSEAAEAIRDRIAFWKGVQVQ